jgi:hypothetical protein
MTRSMLGAVCVLAFVTASGCIRGRSPEPYDPTWRTPEPPPTMPSPVPDPSGDGTLLALGATQWGDMGDILDYSGDATVTSTSYSPTYTSMRLDSVGSGWWVMNYVRVSNIDILNAPAGTYRSSSSSYDGTDPRFDSTGCSGFSYGNYTYDSGSRGGEMTITDNADGSRTIEFRLDFSDYDTSTTQQALGTITFRAGDVAPRPDPTPTPMEPVVEAPIVTSDLWQEGTMGEVAGYSAAATATGATYYGSTSSIRLDSSGDGWWVMSYLSIGGLDLATASGTYRASAATSDPAAPQLSVTGCSGAARDAYSFCGGAEDVEITIVDGGDGSRRLDMTALYAFGGASQVSLTRFVYRIESAPPTTF